MIKRNVIHLMGFPMHAWTMQETVDVIRGRLDDGRFTQHSVVNVAKLVNMQKDPVLAESVTSCDIVNIDGAGVIAGARLLGLSVPERVTGIDLFHRLLSMAEIHGHSVYLLGAEGAILERAVKKIREDHPHLEIAGCHHGYFWDEESAVVQDIQRSGAEMLFVAISSPKKENFINKWKDVLGVNFVMGVGGTFDVVAGKVSRAPVWMQEIGLEWFYRLLQEPARMWKRYLATNSAFAWMLLKAKFKG